MWRFLLKKIGEAICINLKNLIFLLLFIETFLGDIFFIHNDLGDGWLWVTAHRTGEQGLVFKDLLSDLDENIDPNAVFPWFHRNLTKSEAVELLVRAGTYTISILYWLIDYPLVT